MLLCFQILHVKDIFIWVCAFDLLGEKYAGWIKEIWFVRFWTILTAIKITTPWFPQILLITSHCAFEISLTRHSISVRPNDMIMTITSFVVGMVPRWGVKVFSFDSNYVYVGAFSACLTGMNHKFQLFGLNFGCNKEIWPTCGNINTLFHNMSTFTTPV